MVDPNARAFAATYIGLLILLVIVLAGRVILLRRAKRIGIGDGGDAALALAIRVHANCVETGALLIALLIALPLYLAPEWLIHLVGFGGLAGRVAHAIGLSRSRGSSPGRVAGMVLSLSALGIGAGALILLAWLRP